MRPLLQLASASALCGFAAASPLGIEKRDNGTCAPQPSGYGQLQDFMLDTYLQKIDMGLNPVLTQLLAFLTIRSSTSLPLML